MRVLRGLLVMVIVASACDGAPRGGGKSAGASPAAGSVTVDTLSFVPPDRMRRVAPSRSEVALQLVLDGATARASVSRTPPPGLMVYKSGRDVGSVRFRVGVIRAKLSVEAPGARFAEREVKIRGAVEARLLETSFTENGEPARQVDVVIGTTAGPQYAIRYGAAQNAFDQAGVARMLATAVVAAPEGT
ncbi:hypothetical protein Arub01_04430 [Actinomadura rubrobrunea]|uniref:Lipoprotein n=2 Tax=Actinomadura rubrobrunea TaxID=115335 RepID=A0A9W6PSB7_9ACTN|nr:hypothetical protein Arub01_04430 [Actinomadura rubrobrunea]